MAKLYPPYIEGVLPAFCIGTNEAKSYSSTTTYQEGDLVQESDNFYISIQNNNIGQDITDSNYFRNAEYDEIEGNGIIAIPFAHNKAVSKSDAQTMAIKVKTVQNDMLITDFIIPEDQIDWINNEIQLKVENSKIIIDNEIVWDIVVQRYWKIQIAYVDTTNTVGYYSTVGVIKCTSKPRVYIEGLSEAEVKNNQSQYIGVYEQLAKGDVTEKVYSSKFIITDSSGNEILNTGDVLHNVINDVNSYTSKDILNFNQDLEYGNFFQIKYEITTNNGLVCSSPTYKITQQKSLSMELKGDLIADMNFDDGYVDIKIEGALKNVIATFKNKINNTVENVEFKYITPTKLKKEINLKQQQGYNLISTSDDGEETGLGAFILYREDSQKPGYWEELTRFALEYESPTRTIFRDFTVEQGKTYYYSVKQYNNKNIFSDRRISNKVYVDFEDMFLFDGEKQLKLRFNPQVSSFKTQLSESRTDTIGSKYPYFFRNAKIGYKTFPVSGLISMLSDDNEFFLSYKDIFREDFSTDRHDVRVNKKLMPNIYKENDLLANNFMSERLFKLAVLDWVNNGKVKLFRSPGEGNYLVRLMENSLTPQPALGRMLHTYTGTAYECATNDYLNLLQYGIIKDTSKDEIIASGEVRVINWNEIRLNDPDLLQQFNVVGVSNEIISASNSLKNALTLKQYNIDDKIIWASSNLLQDVNGDNIYTTMLRFTDVFPGTKFRLVHDISGEFDSSDYIDIEIGATGAYYADDVRPIYGIYLLGAVQTGDIANNAIPIEQNFVDITGFDQTQPVAVSGTISYQYDAKVRSSNAFDSISSITSDTSAYVELVGQANKKMNIISAVSNVKDQATYIALSNYFKRPIEYLYYASGDFIRGNSIISGENIFNDVINDSGYRDLHPKYLHNLYWEIPSGGLSILTEKASNSIIKLPRTKNTNGLSDDWWNVLDWATYYAKVAAFSDGKNIWDENLDISSYYPDKTLGNYRNSTDANFYPSKEDNQAALSGYTFMNTGSQNAQVIWVDENSKTWGMHILSCGHVYTDFLPDGRIFSEFKDRGVPATASWYVYKPTFAGEAPYYIDEDNNVVVSLRAYQKAKEETESDWFDDQENMEYSPFSLYVLQSDILTVNGVKESLFKHITKEIQWQDKTNYQIGDEVLFNSDLLFKCIQDVIFTDDEQKDDKDSLKERMKKWPSNESIYWELQTEKTHVVNHLFERYYIDRYLNAKTAEERLTERTLLAKRLGASSDAYAAIVAEATPLYVLDPWYGKIYEVGKDFMYDPTVTYNNNEIDLREILRYSLDGINAEGNSITIGNGVYCDMFYQKVTIEYDFEDSEKDYLTQQSNLNDLISKNDISSSYNLQKVQQEEVYNQSYNDYIESLTKIINNWTVKQS